MTEQQLTAHLDTYLRLRTTLGFRVQQEPSLLRAFVQFVTQRAAGEPVRAALAVEWACLPSQRGPRRSPAQRLSMVRRFLTYVRAHAPETEVPDHHLVAGARRRLPFLFTPAQVVTLVQVAQQAKPHDSLRPHTLATLIGLLASTGLRISEALHLDRADVQLEADPPRLLIAPTKFHKARWVPLHTTTATQLRQYQRLRQRHFPRPTTDRFFVSAKGKPVNHDALWAWFSQTCRQLGFWPTSDDARRPCLHSLRHSFAVQRVLQWYEAGLDVYGPLPHLSVYLGHVRPQESYWYLTATPELLTQAAHRFAQFVGTGGET
ncbi:MAG: integrase [Deltaproteobacteria bacterium]|nr:integrase [Deltaproteobacteria bacterium]